MKSALPFVLALSVMLAAPACERTTRSEAPVTTEQSPVVASRSSLGGPDASVLSEFDRRLRDYIALQKQLNATLKQPPEQATPREIDAHQRALGALVAKARPDARQGDIFGPEMQAFVRGVMRRVLDGQEGATRKASIMDENPVGTAIKINGRYPDTVPLSTMPPDVLAALPPLPDELEYRFVGNSLILLDAKSHLIVDFVADAFAV
jgi:hypothetical protein